MNESLSRIAAELFEQSRGNEELSSKIHRLRDELKKRIEGGDTLFGKFRELMASFEAMIPDEKQRYTVAIKALSTTSKLTGQEIVAAINKQLEELTILKKVFMPAQPGQLKAMETKARETRDEIAKLRETIGRLENEEKTILSDMAAREKELELVEKAVGDVFTDLGEEIAAVKKRLEELAAENVVSHSVLPEASVKKQMQREEKGGNAPKIESPMPAEQPDSKWQKKCPMCGGQMNFFSNNDMWQCYSCAYEEAKQEEVPDKIETPESPAQQDTKGQKKCPMCGGQMNFLLEDEAWQCYSCAYEESKTDAAPGKNEETKEQANAPARTPAFLSASDIFPENHEPTKASAPSKNQPPLKKKTCPSCRRKMQWIPMENAWRCPYCDYERRI